jgi:hypothetical protein
MYFVAKTSTHPGLQEKGINYVRAISEGYRYSKVSGYRDLQSPPQCLGNLGSTVVYSYIAARTPPARTTAPKSESGLAAEASAAFEFYRRVLL